MVRGRSLVEGVEVTDTLTGPTALACCEVQHRSGHMSRRLGGCTPSVAGEAQQGAHWIAYQEDRTNPVAH